MTLENARKLSGGIRHNTIHSIYVPDRDGDETAMVAVSALAETISVVLRNNNPNHLHSAVEAVGLGDALLAAGPTVEWSGPNAATFSPTREGADGAFWRVARTPGGNRAVIHARQNEGVTINPMPMRNPSEPPLASIEIEPRFAIRFACALHAAAAYVGHGPHGIVNLADSVVASDSETLEWLGAWGPEELERLAGIASPPIRNALRKALGQ